MKKAGHIYIIAEAGVNHNGSLDLAKQLIDAAAEARADAVKFQTFKAENLVSGSAPKAQYQMHTTDTSESQLEMLKRLELDESAHRILAEHCGKQGIQFLSTPFDAESVELLSQTLDLPLLKISSGEITDAPLLLKAARTGKPVILSTGMSTLAEVRTALEVIAFGCTKREDFPSLTAFRQAYQSKAGQKALKTRITLLHCTTEYPASFDEVNLRAMDTMREAFGLPVGLSDHTPGIAIPIAAAARGATVIEKHFTLDRSLPGPDHKASLEPEELRVMVKSIREVENALGSGRKLPTRNEWKNMRIARRSLVALKDIRKGERYTEENLGCKRPGTGMPPSRYWQLLGKKANKDYRRDEMVGL